MARSVAISLANRTSKERDLTYWLAVLAYVVPTFPLGYFWHLKTFAPVYARLEMYRNDVIIPMGLGSMILQGLFFAWAYPKLFDTSADHWLSSALQFWLIFGVLAWSFLVLPVAAKYRMTSVKTFLMLETAFTAIQFAIAGVLLALVYRA
ncbi:MAG: hypothetical protein HC844_05275 [Tabrizicola sp.]|nr:hypothetical protein [Tabrizicola sp.]